MALAGLLYLEALQSSSQLKVSNLANSGENASLRIRHWKLDAPEITESSSMPTDHVSADKDYHASFLSLFPGDLPGYTGWARPSRTLALHCSIDDDSSAIAFHYPTLTLRITCHADHSHSLFDARAFGPSLVAGRVTKLNGKSDSSSSSYTAQFDLWESGRFTVEVVMAYSNITAKPFSSYPLGPNTTEPAYEGYLLPGFPLTVDVKSAVSTTAANSLVGTTASKSLGGLGLKLCFYPHVIINATTGTSLWQQQQQQPHPVAYHWNTQELGRWKVVQRNGLTDIGNSSFDTDDKQEVSLSGYQTGLNSLGFQMDYFFQECNLPSQKEAAEMLRSRANTVLDRVIHIVFVGDSNMRRQNEMFTKSFLMDADTNRRSIPNIVAHYISTNDGLISRMADVLSNVREIEKHKAPYDDVYILFNAGLHDIAKLCSQRWASVRAEFLAESDVEGESCVDMYRNALTDLVVLLQELAPKLMVFQSTTASWPKWGNGGFSWPAATTQTLPLDPHFCDYFNQMASFPIMSKFGIGILDAYWMTRSRPDHRETAKENVIGSHMVHAGPEVYDALLRQWTTAVVTFDDT